MQRLYSMTDTTNGRSTPLINNMSYGPAGELLAITTAAYTESRSYNARLQLTGFNGITYTYSGSQNNGRIARIQLSEKVDEGCIQ